MSNTKKLIKCGICSSHFFAKNCHIYPDNIVICNFCNLKYNDPLAYHNELLLFKETHENTNQTETEPYKFQGKKTTCKICSFQFLTEQGYVYPENITICDWCVFKYRDPLDYYHTLTIFKKTYKKKNASEKLPEKISKCKICFCQVPNGKGSTYFKDITICDWCVFKYRDPLDYYLTWVL